MVFAASANAKSEETATAIRDDTLDIISSLQVPKQCLRRIAETNEALVFTLRWSSATSRAHTTLLLELVTAVLPPSRLASLP